MSEFRYKMEELVTDAEEGIRKVFRIVVNCKTTQIHPATDHENMERENIQGPNLSEAIEVNRESSL